MADPGRTWPLRLSWGIIIFMIFLAVFAEFLANDAPILGQGRNGQWVSWMWMTDAQVDQVDLKWSLDPPVRFDASDVDLESANYQPPLTKSKKGTHWLGTDLIGRDMAAGLIYGCRLSLLTAFLATAIALIIGLPVGLICGYLGDWRWQPTSGQIFWSILGFAFLIYAWTFRMTLASGVQVLLYGSIVLFFYLAYRGPAFGARRRIPLDTLFTRLVELMVSLPGLIVLLAVSAAIENKSLAMTAVIIGALRWVRIGQVSRNESIRLKEETFVESARALGMSSGRIIFKHVLPNIWGPVMVIAVFSIAGFILLESSLSFLGIGVALENQTWGSMLAESRRFIKAWWLAIFPGLAIFLTILAVNRIGQGLRAINDRP